MIKTAEGQTFWGQRYVRRDLGVALVVGLALLLGWLLREQVTTRTKVFQDNELPFLVSYPFRWVDSPSLQDVALKVMDPFSDSSFKTTLTVETRPLDPASPPSVQALLDRRVDERSVLTGYYFISNEETTVDGQKAMNYTYAYVVQPIDQPRRVSLPVVVVARETIVLSKDRSYYITVAAPANEFESSSATTQRILQSVKVQ